MGTHLNSFIKATRYVPIIEWGKSAFETMLQAFCVLILLHMAALTEIFEIKEEGPKLAEIFENKEERGPTQSEIFKIKEEGPKQEEILEIEEGGTKQEEIFEIKEGGPKQADIFEIKEEGSPKQVEIFETKEERGPKQAEIFKIKEEGPKQAEIFEIKEEGVSKEANIFEIKEKESPKQVEIFETKEERGPKPAEIFKIKEGGTKQAEILEIKKGGPKHEKFEMIVEESPSMILGENELRRLEPYFLKQAWNWGQLYEKRCTMNPHPGSCTRALTRWFFYPTFHKCYAFLYGGCGGTGNRFMSKKACLKTCIPKQRPLPAPMIFNEPTLPPPPDVYVLNSMLSRTDNETVKAVQQLAAPITKPPTTEAPLEDEPDEPPLDFAAANATAYNMTAKVNKTIPHNSTLIRIKEKTKRESVMLPDVFDFNQLVDLDKLDRIIL